MQGFDWPLGPFFCCPDFDNSVSTIYLDHNSTTPIDPAVADAMRECHAIGYLNPASQHRAGQLARQVLEKTRASVLKILGANVSGMATDQLILTSGGTESNNLALVGLALSARDRLQSMSLERNQEPWQILVSAIEHPSIIGAAEHLVRLGFVVRKIPIDQAGVCRLDEFEKLIEQPTLLVSLMLANNETGVLQPVSAVAARCRARKILIHTDAVQAVGKIPVDFTALGVDALTLTAHKFNGPRGIGGLLIRHGVSIEPQLFGGFQQMAIRPGTEDVALAVGLLTALELDAKHPDRLDQVRKLRDDLQTELTTTISGCVAIGAESPRVPTTLNVAFPGVDRQSFLLAADLQGLAISTGSACASGSSELSPVLLAMGLPKNLIESSIRISLGVSNTPAEIAAAGRRIFNLVNHLRQ